MALLNQSASSYYSGNDLGSYQFISLDHIINNFLISYVGDNKIIGKAKRTDVAFHAQRGLQEFSYDTLKSIKSQEITLPPSSVMSLPQDYVNYVKLTSVDSSGIEHVIYPTSKTSNPFAIQQGYNEDYTFAHKDLELAEQTGTTLTQSSEVLLSQTGPFSLSLIDATGSYVTNPETLISIGMSVTGENVPLGTVITGFNAQTAEINQAIPVGTYDLTFTLPNNTVEDTTTSNTTIGVLLNPNSNIVVGMLVSGTGVPSNTIVTSINSTIITFNNIVPTLASGILNYTLKNPTSDTWESYKSATPSENSNNDYEDDVYWPNMGGRYGIDPQYAQVNGSFFIDELQGKIHFSSNVAGKNIILKYISDGLGTEEEMVVHKFAEEAMYKHIAYAILSTRLNIPEYLVARLKKERFAETRKAKLRLSNIKIEELTQVLRGKSKQIKH